MSCSSGKQAYVSKRRAKLVMRRVSFNRTRLLPYRCGECGEWHLGHRSSRRQPA